MADNNFFDNKPQTQAQDPNPTEEKFTVGDKEYSMDELKDLVSQGEFAREVETKFNTKLDKVVPDYTRASQEAADLRAKLAAKEKLELDNKPQNQLSPEEVRTRARQEAISLGLMTDETAPALIRAELAGYELRKETDGLVGELKQMGIQADPKIILRYMDAADLESPKDAAEQLYGNQIKFYQEAELNKAKPEGLYAERGTEGGSFKLPADVKVTADNVEELFKQAIGAE